MGHWEVSRQRVRVTVASNGSCLCWLHILGWYSLLFFIFAGGKKPGSTVQQATPKATNTDGNTNMRGESVRSLERRERRELEAKEWPKLGATEEKEVIISYSTLDTHHVYIALLLHIGYTCLGSTVLCTMNVLCLRFLDPDSCYTENPSTGFVKGAEIFTRVM